MRSEYQIDFLSRRDWGLFAKENFYRGRGKEEEQTEGLVLCTVTVKVKGKT